MLHSKAVKKGRNYARRIIIIITLDFLSVHMTEAFINPNRNKVFFYSDSP
jgi:hypothetical protein